MRRQLKLFILFALLTIFPFWQGLQAQSPTKAMEMSLEQLNGPPLRLSDFRGKVVVVNFWATWCPPCLEEIPDLVEFQRDFKDKGVQIIGINYMERAEKERLETFVKEHGINYPIVYGSQEQIMEFANGMGGIFGLPVTKIINRKGEIVASQVGAITRGELETMVKSLP